MYQPDTAARLREGVGPVIWCVEASPVAPHPCARRGGLRGASGLHDDDAVGARILTGCQGCEGGLCAEGEGGGQNIGRRAKGVAVGAARAEQDHQPLGAAVALLEGGGAELGLGVAQSGNRFDRDRGGAGQQGVEGPLVAGDVEWRFELPGPSVADSSSKSSKETQLGSVAKATPRGIEACVEPQPHRGSVTTDIGKAKLIDAATFGPAHVEARNTKGTGHIPLAEASSETRFSQLIAQLCLDAPADNLRV